MSVIVPFVLPHRDAAAMLIPELQAVLGDCYAGFTARKDHIEVFTPDDISDALRAQIEHVVVTHDYTLRTPEQLAIIARDARLKELRALMQARQWDDPVLEWLALEVSVIKERLGITE